MTTLQTIGFMLALIGIIFGAMIAFGFAGQPNGINTALLAVAVGVGAGGILYLIAFLIGRIAPPNAELVLRDNSKAPPIKRNVIIGAAAFGLALAYARNREAIHALFNGG